MPSDLWRMLAAPAQAASMIAAAFFTNSSHAAEVRVLSAAAMQSVFKEIKAEFERTSGHKLIIHYGTIGAVNQWLLGGEEADFVIGSDQSMPALVKQGKIESGSLIALCKTGIGVVVASDTAVSVGTAEELKRALINAKTIVYADPARGGAAGIHVAKVIEKLGLTDQVKPKLRLGAGGDITDVTLSLGTGAVGITQISEIADKPGAKLAGPLSNDLQNYTVFMAGIPPNLPPSEGTSALIKFLRSPTAIAVIKAKGMVYESPGGSE